VRALVTGAGGFIGSKLCARLIRDGHSVRGLVRQPSQAKQLKKKGVDAAVGDLLAPETLQAATEGVDTVFHFAAVFRKEVPRDEIWATNVSGIENLLAAADLAGVQRFIHCSSTSVYGLFPQSPTTEISPFVPIRGDLYQESKLAAEERVNAYGSEGKLDTTIFRTTGVYGPGDLRFLKLFKAIAHERFAMIGAGTVPFSMIHIDDLLDGILSCATRPVAVNNHYLLTGNDPISLNDTARIIAEAAGVPAPQFHVPVMPVYFVGWLMELVLKPLGISPPLYRRRVNFFRITRGFDNSKAKRELGFRPKYDLAAGAKNTLDWYKRKHLL
jgi:nucleoside-diphosphate-sugar epimerase